MSSSTKIDKWGKIVQSFTAKTTFHGVRYIAEETRFISRRIAWTFVVITVIGAFSYAIVNRILHYREYPSNIELEVGYMERVPFPVVTLCNQNPYRLTALQNYGVYDIMTNTYRAQRPGQIKQDDGTTCDEKYLLNPVVCHIPAKVTYSQMFVEVTVSTCKELCTHNAYDSCSGFLYEEASKSCTLTSFTGEDKEWYIQEEIDEAVLHCQKVKAYFYRRVRCIDETLIHCTFEDGLDTPEQVRTELCKFDHDHSMSENWVKTKGKDNTYNTDNGHFLQLFETDNRPGNIARIQTDYMNTTSMCIMVFGFLGGPSKGVLSIKVMTESLEISSVRELTSSEYENDQLSEVTGALKENQGRGVWVTLFAELPAGTHRVVIEGTRAQQGPGGLAIDDIKITECSQFYKNCIQSPRGNDYMGNISTTADGVGCYNWESSYSYVYYFWYSYQIYVEESLYLPDIPIQNAENYCRSPLDTDRPEGPVCLASGYQACDIERCSCQESEFRCDDGVCVPWALTCDRKQNCLDGSDETKVCSFRQTITCDFEHVYICGYSHLNNDDIFLWERQYDASVDDLAGNAHSMQLSIDYDRASPGETALVITPFSSFPNNTIVTLNIKYSLNPDTNGIIVWLLGSQGMAHHPALIHGLSEEAMALYGLSRQHNMVHSIKESTAGWVQYDICVPGGPGVIQSLVMQAVYNTEDVFAVDSVTQTGISCDMPNLQENAFANKTTVDCAFDENVCGYSVVNDHMLMEWNLVPFSAINDIFHLYDSWSIPSTGCTNCIHYEGFDYSSIHMEAEGSIVSPGYPGYSDHASMAWLIKGPENTTIVLHFLDFDIEYHKSCNYDRLVIHDVVIDNETRLCGKSQPDFYSEGNILRLNFTSDYWVTYRGFKLNFQIRYAENTTKDFTMGLKYTGGYSLRKYVSRLVSPGVTPSSESCLTFTFVRRSPFAVTLVSTDRENVTLFEDSVVSVEEPLAVSMSVKMESLTNASSVIVFYGQKSSTGYVHYSIFLKDVRFHEESCMQYSTGRQTGESYGIYNIKTDEVDGKFDQTLGACDFKDAHQCGYIDDSVQPIKWVRDKIKDTEGKVRTVMRYGTYSPKYRKVSGRLVSPILRVTSDSCVKVWSGINTNGEDKLMKFGIETLPTQHNETEIVTSGYVEGSAMAFVEEMYKIPSGQYRLVFQAIPKDMGVFLYISDVVILSDCILYQTTAATSEATTAEMTTFQSLPTRTQSDVSHSSQAFHQTTGAQSAGVTSSVVSTAESTIGDIEYLSTGIYKTTSEDNTAYSVTRDNLTYLENLTDSQLYEDTSSNGITSGYTGSRLNVTDEMNMNGSFEGQTADWSTTEDLSTTDDDVYVTSAIYEDSTSAVPNSQKYMTTEEIQTTVAANIHITNLYLDEGEAEAMLINNLDFAFSNFTNTVSHQRSDLLLSCLWNGLPCNESFITDTDTDMGTCISFNAENITDDYLSSDKSGPLYGLRMTLNVENYEHVEDIGTDAGIKMHFYPPTEVPIMKNMGYAVSPGYHALFSLKYTTSTFLEPDYGTCGTTELYSYPDLNYTNSHCLTQCSMDVLWETCKCHLPYMPAGEETMCSMPDYLTCVIPGETTSRGGLCECPDACNQVLYDAQLSSSALSGLALHSLLSDKETQVLTGYQQALNLQQRLEKGSLLHFLTEMNVMNEENKILSNFLQKTSIFTVIQKGLNNIIGVVEDDVTVSSVELYESETIYNDHLKRERLYALDQFDHLQTLLQDVLYILSWNYNPCVTWYEKERNPQVLISKLHELWEVNKKLNETLVSFANTYRCNIYSDTCSENLDFSKFFSLYNSGFQWAEDISFPQKAVLQSGDSFYCKHFIARTWSNFTITLSQHIEYYAVALSNYSQVESCKYLRPESYVSLRSQEEQLVTDNSTSMSNDSYTENMTVTTNTVSEDPELVTTEITPTATEVDIQDMLMQFIQNILDGPGSLAIQDDLPAGVFDYWSAVEFFKLLNKDVTDMTDRVTKCFTDYGQFIEKAVQWRRSLTFKPEETVRSQEVSVNTLEAIQMWYDVLQKKYGLNRLTKHELAELITDDYETYSLYSVLDMISAMRNRFEQEVVLPLYVNIVAMSTSIIDVYEDTIDDMDKFSKYMGEAFKGDYLKTMSIFKKPKQNLQSGQLSYVASMEQVSGMIGNNVMRYITNTGGGYIKDVVQKYFRDLEVEVDKYYGEYVELESNLISSVEQLIGTMEDYKTSTYLDQTFIRDNIMQVDVYFGELKYSKTEQKVGYTVGDFFSDLGGYLGLLLGASIVTVCEVLDLIVYNALRMYLDNKEKRESKQKDREDRSSGDTIDKQREKQERSSGDIDTGHINVDFKDETKQ